MPRSLRTYTTDDAYRAIRKLIVEKQLTPGSRINQIKLAERLHSSRTPVVKALHLLAAHNLVRHVPNSGFFVTELSVEELYELFTLREALETAVVRDLAQSITDDQLAELQQLVKAYESSLKRGDEVGYQENDEAFHTKLVHYCPNALVKRMFEEFEIHSRCFMAGLIRSPTETFPEHLELVDALADRDVERACRIIGAHMAATRELMADLVTRLRRIGVDPTTVRFKDVTEPVGQKRV